MQHLHRLEIRIVVPRRAPLNIQIDAQDILPAAAEEGVARRTAAPITAGVVMPR